MDFHDFVIATEASTFLRFDPHFFGSPLIIICSQIDWRITFFSSSSCTRTLQAYKYLKYISVRKYIIESIIALGEANLD